MTSTRAGKCTVDPSIHLGQLGDLPIFFGPDSNCFVPELKANADTRAGKCSLEDDDGSAGEQDTQKYIEISRNRTTHLRYRVGPYLYPA